MDFVKIVLLAILCVVAIVLCKRINGDIALPLTVASSVLLLILLCDQLYQVIYAFYGFVQFDGYGQAISCVVKVVGIGYLAEFCNNLCVDANCKSVGDKVLLSSKIAIVYCVLPIVRQLFELLAGFLT